MVFFCVCYCDFCVFTEPCNLMPFYGHLRGEHLKFASRNIHERKLVVYTTWPSALIPTELSSNNSKSVILLLHPTIERSLGTWSINVKPVARNQTLTFEPRIQKVFQSCFLQIRIISENQTCTLTPRQQKVTHPLVFSRLKYCNSLLWHKPKVTLQLQLVQNTAARLLTGLKRQHHITRSLLLLGQAPSTKWSGCWLFQNQGLLDFVISFTLLLKTHFYRLSFMC